jgi:hypothetical protein
MRRRGAGLPALLLAVAGCAGGEPDAEVVLPLGPNLPFTLLTVLDRETLLCGDSVRITLTVTNRERDITVEFPSTCQTTFTIRNGDGQDVAPAWLCGLGTTYRTFVRGAESFTFFWTRDGCETPWLMPSGRYRVLAGLGEPLVLASSPVSLWLP